MRLGIWIVAITAVLVALDQALLWMERKAWINYRRRGLSRSGAAFHALTLESVFNPGAEKLLKIKYTQEQEQDESGDTNRPGRDDDAPRASEGERTNPE